MTGKGIADRFAFAKSFVPKHRCVVALLHMMIVVKPFRVLPPGDIRTSAAQQRTCGDIPERRARLEQGTHQACH